MTARRLCTVNGRESVRARSAERRLKTLQNLKTIWVIHILMTKNMKIQKLM